MNSWPLPASAPRHAPERYVARPPCAGWAPAAGCAAPRRHARWEWPAAYPAPSRAPREAARRERAGRRGGPAARGGASRHGARRRRLRRHRRQASPPEDVLAAASQDPGRALRGAPCHDGRGPERRIPPGMRGRGKTAGRPIPRGPAGRVRAPRRQPAVRRRRRRLGPRDTAAVRPATPRGRRARRHGKRRRRPPGGWGPGIPPAHGETAGPPPVVKERRRAGVPRRGKGSSGDAARRGRGRRRSARRRSARGGQPGRARRRDSCRGRQVHPRRVPVVLARLHGQRGAPACRGPRKTGRQRVVGSVRHGSGRQPAAKDQGGPGPGEARRRRGEQGVSGQRLGAHRAGGHVRGRPQDIPDPPRSGPRGGKEGAAPRLGDADAQMGVSARADHGRDSARDQEGMRPRGRRHSTPRHRTGSVIPRRRHPQLGRCVPTAGQHAPLQRGHAEGRPG